MFLIPSSFPLPLNLMIMIGSSVPLRDALSGNYFMIEWTLTKNNLKPQKECS